MILRPMLAADIPAAMHLCISAGWNQLEDDWSIFFDSPGSGAFLAEKDNRIVGTVAFIRYNSLAWIAMMLVDPAERRAGIGARLMEEALAALRDCSCVGLDATPMGEPLYRRYGFVKQCAMVRTQAMIDAGKFGMPARQARPMRSGDLAAVLQHDREVFGADRSQLLRSLFARAPECAWVADGAYCFGRPGRLFYQLGPIVAGDRRAAQDLVTHGLSKLARRLVAIDASCRDREWIAWLASIGFAEERSFARMFRGSDQHPGMPERQFAITGPEFA